MSLLLNNPTGRPRTVLALVHTLRALGGTANKAKLLELLMPLRKTSTATDPFDQTVACARGLDFVSVEGKTISLKMRSGICFEDAVHAQLSSSASGPEKLILALMASVVVRIEDEGAEWLRADAPRFAALARERLPEGLGTFNKDRVPAWRDWVSACGLGYQTAARGNLARPIGQFTPRVTTRLGRELQAELRPSAGTEVKAKDVIQLVASRMPYLDGGSLFEDAKRSFGLDLAGRCSMALTDALRDLELQGVLTLQQRGGDDRNMVQLAEDGAQPPAFESVRFLEGVEA